MAPAERPRALSVALAFSACIAGSSFGRRQVARWPTSPGFVGWASSRRHMVPPWPPRRPPCSPAKLASRRQAPITAPDTAAATSLGVEERRQIQQLLRRYRAEDSEARANLAITAALWSGGLAVLHFSGGHWAAILLMALCMMRCFMVFHDAAHLSFFESAEDNRRLAQVIQYFCNYSYREWDRVHNSHHAHFGDATVRDTSLTIFYSEEELRRGSWGFRLAHRIVREPLFFYPFAGLLVFFLNKPQVHGLYRVVLPIAVWLVLGAHTAIAYMLAAWVAGSLGVCLFHLQHHCNVPYRVAGPSQRSSVDAAMLGSTRIPFPFPLALFTMGIEYHHIHHLDVRVPGYRLQRCDAEGDRHNLWRQANTVGLWRAFRSLFHTKFAGAQKVEDEAGRPARFTAFWPYNVLGLEDAARPCPDLDEGICPQVEGLRSLADEK